MQSWRRCVMAAKKLSGKSYNQETSRSIRCEDGNSMNIDMGMLLCDYRFGSRLEGRCPPPCRCRTKRPGSPAPRMTPAWFPSSTKKRASPSFLRRLTRWRGDAGQAKDGTPTDADSGNHNTITLTMTTKIVFGNGVCKCFQPRREGYRPLDGAAGSHIAAGGGTTGGKKGIPCIGSFHT